MNQSKEKPNTLLQETSKYLLSGSWKRAGADGWAPEHCEQSSQSPCDLYSTGHTNIPQQQLRGRGTHLPAQLMTWSKLG